MSNSFDSEIEDLEIGSIANLAENIVYRLPGCDNLMIRKSLQAAYSDFARVTCCFTDEQITDIEDDEIHYPVHPKVSGMFVDSICDVWIGKRRLVRPQQYRVINLGGTPTVVLNDCYTCNSNQTYVREDGSVDSIVVRRSVDRSSCDSQKMRVRFVQIPKIGSEAAPSWFLNKFGEAVVAGCLYRLMSMNGKAWSDAAQAQNELVRYENFTTTARLNSVSDDASQFGNCHVDAVDTSTLL